MEAVERSALSVSAAMSLAKGALEGIGVKIIGEISELSNKPGYKAVYFTIKDQSASLPCMMWNNRFAASDVQLSVGALVEVTGRFSLYAAKGRMNFDVQSISLAGEGDLRLKVANLAKKLDAEGLFSAERKKHLPAFPQSIGLVTSPRGAAVHDVLRTLRRRYPLAKILLAGVPVEGTDASKRLSEGLLKVADAGVEVILLVRGGGSFEDLMPFNDEGLVRTIASLSVPVITGIGHEPDTSIADMAADLRASTPTAAAEAVSASFDEIRLMLESFANKIGVTEKRYIAVARSRLDLIGAHVIFKEPTKLFENEAQTVDELSARLAESLDKGLQVRRNKLDHLKLVMGRSLPYLISRFSVPFGGFVDRMKLSGKSMPNSFENQIALAASRLNDLSPLKVIARGYSFVQDDEGSVISSVKQTSKGKRLNVMVKDGSIVCDVCGVEEMELSLGYMEDTYEG